jgi:hypothetical protein
MRRSDLKRYFSDWMPGFTSFVLAGIIGGGLLSAACSRESSTASMTTPTTPPTTTSPSGSNAATNERDVHSFAIPQEARVTHVTLDLRAVMSAEQLTPDGTVVSEGRRFDFRLTHPIPPYLIAIAIGDLAFRSMGPRTGVYTEPAVLESAAYEFGDTEKMVQAAESLGGPYRWGRYDVIVLPPSFPFGGMENPRLTFATPTVLAGDRSLTSLVAHELAHSWSGNLVTNATWNDFWLNEGFTVYFERRIM